MVNGKSGLFRIWKCTGGEIAAHVGLSMGSCLEDMGVVPSSRSAKRDVCFNQRPVFDPSTCSTKARSLTTPHLAKVRESN